MRCLIMLTTGRKLHRVSNRQMIRLKNRIWTMKGGELPAALAKSPWTISTKIFRTSKSKAWLIKTETLAWNLEAIKTKVLWTRCKTKNRSVTSIQMEETCKTKSTRGEDSILAIKKVQQTEFRLVSLKKRAKKHLKVLSFYHNWVRDKETYLTSLQMSYLKVRCLRFKQLMQTISL